MKRVDPEQLVAPHYDLCLTPDEFDVTGEHNAAIAFGWGIHMCLGAGLARLEGRAPFDETLRRFPGWTVDPAGGRMRISSSMRGYCALPFTPVR